jgi:hypothetical protein
MNPSRPRRGARVLVTLLVTSLLTSLGMAAGAAAAPVAGRPAAHTAAAPAAVPANPPPTSPEVPIDWVAHLHGSETPDGSFGTTSINVSIADGPGSCVPGYVSGSVFCSDMTSGAVSSGTLTGPFTDCNNNTYTATEPALTGNNNYLNFLTSPVAGYPEGQVGEIDAASAQYTTECPDGSVVTNGLVFSAITSPSDCTPFTLSPSKDTASGSCSGNAGGPYSFTFTISATYGLSITSPPADKMMALTDGTYFTPKLGPNDRQPEERTLKVEGTAPPGATSITLNGIKAQLSGDTWKADLPVTMAQLGELTLTASDGKVKVEQKDTLIDIEITKPTENADQPITPAPAMPALDATLSVLGYPGDTSSVSFDWTLEVRGETVQRPGTWKGYQMSIATGFTSGPGEAWKPSYEHIVGGIGRLTVTADLPGVLDNPITSEPRWIRISGTNPPAVAAKAYVDENEPQYADTIRHIVCHESRWNQFNTAGFDPDNNGQPPIPDAPDGWKPNPGLGQPLYGQPAGIGISQQDPEDGTVPLVSPDEYWDWQANLQAGISEFHRKLAQAEEWTGDEQRRLNDRLAVILKKANADRVAAGMPTITMTAITVPQLTDKQVIFQAIRYYNGQYEYHFFADYVLSANGFNPVLVGQQRWLGGTSETIYGSPPSPAGHWGPTPSNLHLQRQWVVPFPGPESQGYVDAVRTCKNS